MKMWIATSPVVHTIRSLFVSTTDIVSPPPLPKHRTPVLQPYQAELVHMHVTSYSILLPKTLSTKHHIKQNTCLYRA